MKINKPDVFGERCISLKLVCNLVLIILGTLFTQHAFSQSLLNSTGTTISNNDFSVEYSIGEVTITTLPASHNYITQGLLQPVLEIKECNLLKFMPTAFTPNQDNLNDCFGVKHWPASSSFELQIYNRMGQMVFRTTNILECWNGYYKGMPQPTEAYVYTLKAITIQCGETTVKGSFILIR